MIPINRRKTLALMACATAALAFGAPAIASNKKIRVGALRFTSHSASFIALERGYFADAGLDVELCLLYTSPSPRDGLLSRMPSSA